MLAQEAHRRLSARLGDGERRTRHGRGAGQRTRAGRLLHGGDGAAVGNLLVLDEIQWADDDERGSAWTRLLLAGEYREILLLGALDALPLVERAFPEHELRVFERKLPLEFVGERTLRSLGRGTVVVAFSRRAVLALAGEVNRLHPGRVAVLYGAMPLSSRREEIDRFLSGAADVCVATDVLGHGVNLPCETLLFAETTKFDGQERRNLFPWELAQIAGRAGRFGLVERGHVGVLSGIGWGAPDPTLVESALEPHVLLPGGFRGYRIVDEARIRPRLGDLGVDDPADLDAALVAWHQVALREWAFESWLAVESLQPLRLRLDGGAAPAAGAWTASLPRGHLDARERARRRGQRRSPRDTRARPRRRPGRAAAPELPARSRPPADGVARGRRAGGARGEHPPLVRTPVPRHRGRDDRASGGTGGGRRRARRRTPPAGGGVADDRPLPVVRAVVPTLVSALQPLRGDRGPVLI